MSSHNLSGSTLGQYQIRTLLGEGGMGAVYRAYQANLNREVALKVLLGSLVAHPGYLERFTREAKTAAALEHPHIVPIYDYGVHGDIAFVAMRLLTGGSLAERLDHTLENDLPLPVADEVSDLLLKLASALDYAHSQGVIHRDIKLSNVMFDNHRTPFLVDFGIAKLLGAEVDLTSPGQAVGTPMFMPPEQWRGDALSPSADQYALAVLAYTLLTGRAPFEGDSQFVLMHKHLHEMPTPPHFKRPQLPVACSTVLERALAKVPQDRYPTVTAFAQALKMATASQSGEMTHFFTMPLPRQVRAAPASRPPRPLKHRSLVWGLATLLVLAIVAALIFMLGNGEENGGQEEAAYTLSRTPTDQPASPTSNATEVAQLMETQIWQGFTETALALTPLLNPTSLYETQVANAILTITAQSWTATPTATETPTATATATDGRPGELLTATAISHATLQYYDLVTAEARSISDNDVDGLSYAEELTLGTDPDKSDTDGDGLVDGEEIEFATDALNVDTDDDGLPDGVEVTEFGTDPLQPDSDNDDLTDQFELNFGTSQCRNALDPNDADTDGDNLNDNIEIIEGLDPGCRDTDRDGINDGSDPQPRGDAPANSVQTDTDGDTIADAVDVCPNDATHDVIGNPCNHDEDDDGFVDDKDNCPTEPTQLGTNNGCPADGLLPLVPIMAANADLLVELWRLEIGHSGAELVWSPDGKTLAVTVWDEVWLYSAQHLKDPPRLLEGHSGIVRDMAFSPDGTSLVSGADDGIRLWDLATGQSQTVMQTETNIIAVALSPDGTMLAIGGRFAGDILLWDVVTGDHRYTMLGHTEGVFDLSFNSDGTLLASAGQDGTVRLWNVVSGDLRTFEGHSGGVYGVTFSPDETLLASAGDDSTVRLWDIASGVSRILEGHSDSVSSVEFSRDGTLLASGSFDGSVWLWDVATGESLATLETGPYSVSNIAFGLDGTVISAFELSHTDVDYGFVWLWGLPVAPCNPDYPSRLVVGGRGSVGSDLGTGLRLRDQPGSVGTSVINTYPADTSFVVLDGPVCVNGAAWFNVQIETDGTQGWFVELLDIAGSTPLYTIAPLSD